jgi:hypothetical protein
VVDNIIFFVYNHALGNFFPSYIEFLHIIFNKAFQMKKYYIALTILNISTISSTFAEVYQCPPPDSIYYSTTMEGTWFAKTQDIEWRGFTTRKNSYLAYPPHGDRPMIRVFAGATAWPKLTGNRQTYKIYCTYTTSQQNINAWSENEWFMKDPTDEDISYRGPFIVLSPSHDVEASSLIMTPRPAALDDNLTHDEPHAIFWIHRENVYVCGLDQSSIRGCQFTFDYDVPVHRNPPATAEAGNKRSREEEGTSKSNTDNKRSRGEENTSKSNTDNKRSRDEENPSNPGADNKRPKDK